MDNTFDINEAIIVEVERIKQLYIASGDFLPVEVEGNNLLMLWSNPDTRETDTLYINKWEMVNYIAKAFQYADLCTIRERIEQALLIYWPEIVDEVILPVNENGNEVKLITKQ